MKKYIIYYSYTIEAEDIEKAEMVANLEAEILADKLFKNIEVTVRGTDYDENEE